MLILDGTEIETERHWHTDLTHVLCSNYKQRFPAKLMVGITPFGVICFASKTFGGRLSGAEIVRRSGLLEALNEGGFCDAGFWIMVDRGLSPIGADLARMGIRLIGPPRLRTGEPQFAAEVNYATYCVASLRVHVERAIGAIKCWRFLGSKILRCQLDLVTMAVQVIAALVNLTSTGFLSGAS